MEEGIVGVLSQGCVNIETLSCVFKSWIVTMCQSTYILCVCILCVHEGHMVLYHYKVTRSCSDSGSTPGRLCKLCVDLTDHFVYLKDNQVYKVLLSGFIMYSYEYLYLESNYMHTHTPKQMLYKCSIKMTWSLMMRIIYFNKKFIFCTWFDLLLQDLSKSKTSWGKPWGAWTTSHRMSGSSPTRTWMTFWTKWHQRTERYSEYTSLQGI